MGLLFIDRKNAQLSSANGCVEIRVADALQQRVPMSMLERVVIRTDTVVSGRAMTELAHHGVGLLAIGGRKREKVAALFGAPAKDTQSRRFQILSAHDTRICTTIAGVVVVRKLVSQRRLLHRYSLNRPDMRYPLRGAGKAIASLAEKAKSQTDVSSLRGLEGAAARSYFKALANLFTHEVGFEKRVKRPPTDPVNACLSLGYTLLTNEAVNACWKTGLDPMIGYLHVPEHSRPSLACDLMEPWRCAIDRWVVDMFRKNQLRPGHFANHAGGVCLLNKNGRQVFYTSYARLQPRLAKSLLHACRLLIRYLNDSYATKQGGVC